MSNFWKYFLIISLSLLMAVIGYFGYRYYQVYKNPVISGLNAITPNTPIFFEFRKPLQTIKKLNYQTDLWKELDNIWDIKKFNQQLKTLNSFIIQEDHIRDILERNSMVIALQSKHCDEQCQTS